MKDKINSLGKFWNKPNHAAYLFMLPSILILLIFIDVLKFIKKFFYVDFFLDYCS